MGQQFDSPYTVLEVQCESTLCSVHWYSFPIRDKYGTRNTCSSCRFSSYLQDIKHSKNYKIHSPHSMQRLYFAHKLGNSPRLTQESYEELEWLVTGNRSIECWYWRDVTDAYFDAGGNAMELWTALSSPLGLAAITGIFLLIDYLIYRYISGCYCAVNL